MASPTFDIRTILYLPGRGYLPVLQTHPLETFVHRGKLQLRLVGRRTTRKQKRWRRVTLLWVDRRECHPLRATAVRELHTVKVCLTPIQRTIHASQRHSLKIPHTRSNTVARKHPAQMATPHMTKYTFGPRIRVKLAISTMIGVLSPPLRCSGVLLAAMGSEEVNGYRVSTRHCWRNRIVSTKPITSSNRRLSRPWSWYSSPYHLCYSPAPLCRTQYRQFNVFSIPYVPPGTLLAYKLHIPSSRTQPDTPPRSSHSRMRPLHTSFQFRTPSPLSSPTSAQKQHSNSV